MADHRGLLYGTATHTTHINSAVELPNGDILASLFHQGLVICIQRETGQWKPLLEGLHHPHFVRLHGTQAFTVADSGHGRALLVSMQSEKKVHIEREITLETEWLADCFYDEERALWWLLDAHNSHVVLFEEGSQRFRHILLDPEWRLYSLEPLVSAPSSTKREETDVL